MPGAVQERAQLSRETVMRRPFRTRGREVVASADATAHTAESQSAWRHGVARAVVAVLLGVTQSLGVFLVNNNAPDVAQALRVPPSQVSWLLTAYYCTAMSATVLATKARVQFGLVRFARWAMATYLAVCVLNLLASDLRSALVARAAFGFAATPLAMVCMAYMLQAVPKAYAALGMGIGFACLQFGSPLSRLLPLHLAGLDTWRSFQALDTVLASACLIATSLVHLERPQPQDVFRPLDAASFCLFAASLAMASIVCTQGRAFGWSGSAWICSLTVAAVAAFVAFVVLELRRDNPLIDLRWVCTTPVLRLLLVVLAFRVLLSEHPVGAATMLNTLGFGNAQMHGLFVWVILGTVAGFLISFAVVVRGWLRTPANIGILLIGAAALLDARSTTLTMPDDLCASQALLAMGTAMFLTSTMQVGFIPVLQDGMKNVVSFFGVFACAQLLGSLIGLAAFGTLVEHRYLHYVWAAGPHLSSDVASIVQSAMREAHVRAYADLFRVISGAAGLTFCCLMLVSWRLRARASRR